MEKKKLSAICWIRKYLTRWQLLWLCIIPLTTTQLRDIEQVWDWKAANIPQSPFYHIYSSFCVECSLPAHWELSPNTKRVGRFWGWFELYSTQIRFCRDFFKVILVIASFKGIFLHNCQWPQISVIAGFKCSGHLTIMLTFIVFIVLLHYIRLLYYNPSLFVMAFQKHPNELRLLSNHEKTEGRCCASIWAETPLTDSTLKSISKLK